MVSVVISLLQSLRFMVRSRASLHVEILVCCGSQTWRTFLANHASQIIAADLFVMPTIT